MSTHSTGYPAQQFATGSALHERPQSARLSEEIFNSVADIDVEAWEQVRESGDIFQDLRLLQALETSMAATSRFRYALYRDESGTPMATAVLCTFTIDIGVLADDAWSKWILAQLRRLSRKLVDYRILFCGLPLSACQSSLRFAHDADTVAVMKRLDRTLRRFAREDRASVIVLKEFADEELSRVKPLETLGYRKADSLPTHIIQLNGSTFDDYLKSLGSKKRHNIRPSMKKFAESGIRFVVTSDLEMIERLFTPETYRLYEAVLSRSTSQFEHLPAEFFLEMARQLPDCCEFLFALDEDRVVGFGIQLRTPDAYLPLFVGLDYELNREADLYFNFLYRSIADGAGHGARIVEIGQNAEQVKCTKLAAVQSRRSIYVRGSNPAMNAIIGLLFKLVFPPHPLLSERA